MNKELLDAVIESLSLCTQQANAPAQVSKALVTLWVTVLEAEGIGAAELRSAIIRHISSSKWFPQPADIVELVHGGDQLESRILLAWEKVRDVNRSLVTGASWFASDLDGDELALWCVSRIGLTELANMTDRSRRELFKEFRALYIAGRQSKQGKSKIAGQFERDNCLVGRREMTPALIGRPDLEAIPSLTFENNQKSLGFSEESVV